MLITVFIIITLLALLLFYFGTSGNKRVLFLFLIWQIVIGILAGSKIFESKPYLFPLVILVTLTITFLALRQIGTEKINTNILLSIHVLRIPVELVLFELFLQDKIPYLMTFKGWNFDIINGISALAILIYQIISRRKIKNQFFFLWNISGILFLIFIVSLAILSSPLPIQQFAFEQPNIAVLEFPYCFLPTCIVPIVLMSHILFLKSLNTKFIQK